MTQRQITMPACSINLNKKAKEHCSQAFSFGEKTAGSDMLRSVLPWRALILRTPVECASSLTLYLNWFADADVAAAPQRPSTLLSPRASSATSPLQQHTQQHTRTRAIAAGLTFSQKAMLQLRFWSEAMAKSDMRPSIQ
jgi:hypothetical protein